MTISGVRLALVLSVLVAASALGVAIAAENLGMLVPCALCLLERWPYRIVIGLAVIGLVLPTFLARIALVLVALMLVGSVAMAGVHVGVEAGWWPSPLPECAAPRLMHGTIAERLASMPERPSKPCDEPTYLVPGLPLSIAGMNLAFGVVFLGSIITSLLRTRSTARRCRLKPGCPSEHPPKGVEADR